MDALNEQNGDFVTRHYADYERNEMVIGFWWNLLNSNWDWDWNGHVAFECVGNGDFVVFSEIDWQSFCRLHFENMDGSKDWIES